MRPSRPLSLPAQRLTIALLALLTVIAVAGYATFGRHPEWLPRDAGAMRAYSLAMLLFPRAHIALGAIAAAVVLTRAVGRRWIPELLALYTLSLGSELLGTTIGVPFGPYQYTPGLGARWFGHVPVLIPASWFTMAVASFVLTRRVLGVTGFVATVAAASAILAAWDLVLDPAMSRVTPYWVWGSSGPYYGMPLLNLLGWYLTGVTLMIALLGLRAHDWVDQLERPATRTFAFIYAANLLLPMGIVVAGGIWPAALVAVVVLGVVAIAVRAGSRRAPEIVRIVTGAVNARAAAEWPR